MKYEVLSLNADRVLGIVTAHNATMAQIMAVNACGPRVTVRRLPRKGRQS